MAIGGRRWGRAMGRGAGKGRGATVLRKGNSATPSRPSLPGRHAISTPRAPLGPAATKCAGSADACVRACPLPPPSSLSVCLSHQGTYLCCGVASLSRRRLRRGSQLLLARVRSLSLLLTGRGGARFVEKDRDGKSTWGRMQVDCRRRLQKRGEIRVYDPPNRKRH